MIKKGRRMMRFVKILMFAAAAAGAAALLFSCSSAAEKPDESGTAKSTQDTSAPAESKPAEKPDGTQNDAYTEEAEELAVSAPSPESDAEAATGASPKAAPKASSKPASAEGAMQPRDEQEQSEAPEPRRESKSEPQPTVKYLSADDSNSQASPVIVRKLIREGKYVNAGVVRTYEFLNYYSFDYPPPAKEEVRLIPQMRLLTGSDTDGPAGEDADKAVDAAAAADEYDSAAGKTPAPIYSLQIALRSRDKVFAELPPLNITFLLDTSGSMAGPSLDLAKQFLLEFTDRLRPGSADRPADTFSLVTCNRRTLVMTEEHTVNGRTPRFMKQAVLPNLVANDVTDLEEGLVKAYEIASQSYDYRYVNRVVLISDGAANAGETAVEVIARHAEDTDRQGIYLAGVGVGEGFNDSLMDTVTDKGRGAYIFLDSEEEIGRVLTEERFIANFDVAVKDVRLKMVLPAGWTMEEFHGEQVADTASEVVPQYLAPNDQMIYHLTVKAPPGPPASERAPPDQASPDHTARDTFTFEASYRKIAGPAKTVSVSATVEEMLAGQEQIIKGDAITAYAEALKEITYPLDLDGNRKANLTVWDTALDQVQAAGERLADPQLQDVLTLMKEYRLTLLYGERLEGARDKYSENIAAVLDIPADTLREVTLKGPAPNAAVKILRRLRDSEYLVPREGYKFLALATGPVGSPQPSSTGPLSGRTFPDPLPRYMGERPVPKEELRARRRVYDLHQVVLELTAPRDAKSLSFDFNFFSAEYPDYIGAEFNDTFYAVLEAPSTNNGGPTNISFDSDGNSIEVDNDYFQNPFHPIPNFGTGFDLHGSTGWLRTSWPVTPGENITLTFSVHDEGDGIYDSLVILDNFQWHEYEAVGTTDPLN